MCDLSETLGSIKYHFVEWLNCFLRNPNQSKIAVNIDYKKFYHILFYTMLNGKESAQ